MKRILVILGLLFLAQNVHAALLLGLYEKLRFNREQENVLQIDSLTAENGNIHLQLTCALRYWGKGNYKTARYFLNKAVKEKNDTAMAYLAEMDYYGYGLEKPDRNSALKSANKARSLGNTYAYFIIGKNYYDNKDYDSAFRCFLSVPDDSPNIRLCNYYIAKSYRYGRGVLLNKEKSFEYFTKANMSRSPHWWEKHYHRIAEMNNIEDIAKHLELNCNPELSEMSFLSTTKANLDNKESKIERINKNIERVQERYNNN